MKSGVPQVLNAVILKSFHPLLQNPEALLVNALAHLVKLGAIHRNTLGFSSQSNRLASERRFSLILRTVFARRGFTIFRQD